MADVTYNEQCLLLDGRRMWVLGANVEYARIPPELWADRILAAKQAGFNTIDTACPWMIHEPRDGRFVFDGQSDVKGFLELCNSLGMKSILRPGPFVGSGYDGGGIPGWLIAADGIAFRQSNEALMEKVARYIRKLMAEVAPMQATQGGPIIAVQLEHRWLCSNPEQATKYHGELLRYMRERGIAVPITNANELWQEVPDTIDTWRGWDDLLSHLRQLRTVNPEKPLLVSAFETSAPSIWGEKSRDDRSAIATLWHLAEALAAGSQVVVNPFLCATNFEFLGGQYSGPGGGPATTAIAPDAPLGEAGQRGEKYDIVKRLVTFANRFAHIFAELDPDHRPVAQDVVELGTRALSSKKNNPRSAVRSPSVSIVAQRGTRGRVIFAFSDGETESTTLLLDNGLRMPVYFGDQPVRWYLFDADIAGAGHLEYANISPFAMIGRSIIVFHGPAKTSALMSINGSPIEATVPSGAEPLVVKQRDLTIVICNDEQIDSTYLAEDSVYVGVGGLDENEEPLPRAGTTKAFVIRPGAVAEPVEFSKAAATAVNARSKSITPDNWKCAPATPQIEGTFPRYASLDGPQTLTNCGATVGYGWYRIEMNVTAGRKYQCALPSALDRTHLYLDGTLEHIAGCGPGADPAPFELSLTKGKHLLVALVDNLGRYFDGNDLAMFKGIFDHLYGLKQLRTNKPKMIDTDPVDPFSLHQYIAMRAVGQLSEPKQALWAFKHLKKTAVFVYAPSLPISGTFVLNDVPIHYYAGVYGHQPLNLMLDPATMDAFKRGNNELRFAPDVGQGSSLKKAIAAINIFECADNLTEKATWSFAKWEPPKATSFSDPPNNGKARLGMPCWWKTKVELPASSLPAWLDVSGMSKGQAYINGHNLGRYFTATATGAAVGPQKRLYIPEPWLKPKAMNEVLLFDEHGFDPKKVRITLRHES